MDYSQEYVNFYAIKDTKGLRGFIVKYINHRD